MTQNPFDALGGGEAGGFDLEGLLQQAQQMQSQLEIAQQRLAEARVDGTVAGGAVTVTLNGIGELQAVQIKAGGFDASSDDDLSDLGDLIVVGLPRGVQDAGRRPSPSSADGPAHRRPRRPPRPPRLLKVALRRRRPGPDRRARPAPRRRAEGRAADRVPHPPGRSGRREAARRRCCPEVKERVRFCSCLLQRRRGTSSAGICRDPRRHPTRAVRGRGVQGRPR